MEGAVVRRRELENEDGDEMPRAPQYHTSKIPVPAVRSTSQFRAQNRRRQFSCSDAQSGRKAETNGEGYEEVVGSGGVG